MGKKKGKIFKPVNDFNKDAFAQLLVRAKGDKSLGDFSKNCDISISLMSNYLNSNRDTAPSVSTLTSIADYTKNSGVKLEELLDTAGYNVFDVMNELLYQDIKDVNNELAKLSKPSTSCEISIMQNIISKTLDGLNYKWNMKSIMDEKFIVDIDGEDIKAWVFDVISNIPAGKTVKDLILSRCGLLLTLRFPSECKLTFLTDSKEIYDQISEISPLLFPVKLSVALVDTTAEKVARERRLQTAAHRTEDMLIKKTVPII